MKIKLITKNKIIVALDGMTKARALNIARSLRDHIWGFKINDMLYDDISIIKQLKKFGNVFVDVKLHDIPNTVGNTVKRLSRAGADIITVHAAGGIDMMMAAKKHSGKRRSSL